MAITASAARVTTETVAVDPIVGKSITANAADATDGHKFANDGKTRLRVTNGSGGAITLTIQTQATTRGGYAIADFTESIANSGVLEYGPFRFDEFNDSGGDCFFGVSADTSVTFSLVN